MELLEQSENPETNNKNYRPENVDEFDRPKTNSKGELVCTTQDQYELLYNQRLSCYHSNLEGTMQVNFFKNAEIGKYNDISFYNDPAISPFIMKPGCVITSIKEIQDRTDQDSINQTIAEYRQSLDVYMYSSLMIFPRTTKYTHFYHYSLDHPNHNFLSRYGANWGDSHQIPGSIRRQGHNHYKTIQNNAKRFATATGPYKIKDGYGRGYGDFVRFKYQSISSIRRFEITSKNAQGELTTEYFVVPFYNFPKPIQAYPNKTKKAQPNKKTKNADTKPIKLDPVVIKKEKALRCYDKSTVVNTNGSTITTRTYGIPVSTGDIREFTYIMTDKDVPKEKTHYDQMYTDYKNSVKERNASDQTQTIFAYFISKYPKYKADFGLT